MEFIFCIDGVLTRTKSMPSNSSPDASQRGGLPRSTTEKRRVKTIIDNANVRLEAEAKALHRKKVSLSYPLSHLYQLPFSPPILSWYLMLSSS